jgi:hypothetical protein
MSNLPGYRLSGNLVCRIMVFRINFLHMRSLEAYGINQSPKQKKSSFDQIIGHSGLFHHLRQAEHPDSMYQRCEAR